jgi:hypothetical protein
VRPHRLPDWVRERFPDPQLLMAEATGRSEEQRRGKLNLRVIRDALASVVERRGDQNLHYLDGTTLYGEDDAARNPLPDALHPYTATHRLIGERFARYAFTGTGPFAGF